MTYSASFITGGVSFVIHLAVLLMGWIWGFLVGRGWRKGHGGK